MAQTAQIYTDFSMGQVDPMFAGRIDTGILNKSVEWMSNWIPSDAGGIQRRPGSTFISTTEGGELAVIFPLYLNDRRKYLVEFTHLKCRIINMDGSPWYDSDSIYPVTNFNPSDMGGIPVAKSTDAYPFGRTYSTGLIGGIIQDEVENKYYYEYSGERFDSIVYDAKAVDADDGFEDTGYVLYSRTGTGASEKVFFPIRMQGNDYDVNDRFLAEHSTDNVNFTAVDAFPLGKFTNNATNEFFYQIFVQDKDRNVVNRNDAQTFYIRLTNQSKDHKPKTVKVVRSMVRKERIDISESGFWEAERYAQAGFAPQNFFNWLLKPFLILLTIIYLIRPVWVVTQAAEDVADSYFAEYSFQEIPIEPPTETITTVFNEIHLKGIRWTSDTHKMYLFHPSLPSQVLDFSSNNPSISPMSLTKDTSGGSIDLMGGSGWYPSFGVLFHSRLFLAGFMNDSSVIWASKAGVYTNFVSAPGGADDAVGLKVEGNGFDTIRWIEAADKIYIATASSEFTLETGGRFTATDVYLKKNTQIGSSTVSGFIFKDEMIFVHKDRKRIIGYNYSNERANYWANDLTRYAKNIFGTQIAQVYAQSSPQNILWVLLDDGKLIYCLYDKIQEKLAWGRYETNGVVESIAVLPGSDEDLVFMVVSRNSKRALEKMQFRSESVFLDSVITRGLVSGNLDGLDHLEGMIVDVIRNGMYIGKTLVENGEIELDGEARTITVGLPYRSVIKTHDVYTDQGFDVRKRIVDVVFRVHNSYDLNVSTNGKEYFSVNFSSPNEYTDQPRLAYTGDKRVSVKGTFDSKVSIWIKVDQPMDAHILAIQANVDINGR